MFYPAQLQLLPLLGHILEVRNTDYLAFVLNIKQRHYTAFEFNQQAALFRMSMVSTLHRTG